MTTLISQIQVQHPEALENLSQGSFWLLLLRSA